MKCCYGVSTALPEDVIPLLPRHLVWSHPGGAVNVDALLVSGIDQLRRHWSLVKGTALIVIVFDARVRLDSWRIPELDLSRSLLRQLSCDNVISHRVRNPIQKLLQATAKSFVSNFITLSYKTRDIEKQTLLRREVFGCIWHGTREAYAATINKKSTDILGLLRSQDAQALELACLQIRTGMSVTTAAKQNAIAPFDINYLMKFMSK